MTNKNIHHESQITSIRSRQLSLATSELIASVFASQCVSDYRNIPIKLKGHTIKTDTYILTFVAPQFPTKVNAGYNIESVEKYSCSTKRQKSGHHTYIYRTRSS